MWSGVGVPEMNKVACHPVIDFISSTFAIPVNRSVSNVLVSMDSDYKSRWGKKRHKLGTWKPFFKGISFVDFYSKFSGKTENAL